MTPGLIVNILGNIVTSPLRKVTITFLLPLKAFTVTNVVLKTATPYRRKATNDHHLPTTHENFP